MGSIFHVYTSPVPDGTATSVVRPSDWNSVHAYTLQDAVSLGGNTAGGLALISSGTMFLAGGNNITLSQLNNSVTIIGATGGGAGGIGALMGDRQGAPGVSETYSSGSVILAALGGASVGFDTAGGSQVVAFSAPLEDSLGISNVGNTSGTSGVSHFKSLVFAGGNNITLSQSSAFGAATITISGPNLPVQSNQTLGLYGVGNTQDNSSTTLDARTLSFRAAGSLTVGFTNGSIQFSAPNALTAQTTQSAIKALGASNTGNTAGNTGVSTGVDWVLAGSNNITISESTAAGGPNTLWVSGPNVGGAQTGISGIVASDTTYTSGTVSFSGQANITIGSSVNGATQYVRLSVAAQTNQSAIKGLGVSNTGNTAGNTGLSTGIDWVIAGSNGITASQSTAGGGPNTIWLSGVTIPAAQTGISGIQVSDTTYTSGTVTFRNANGISFGSSGANGVSASYTVPTQTNQTLGLYAVSNTEGASSSSTFDARTLSFQGKGAASVGFSNGSIVIDAPNAAAGNVTFSAGANSSGLGSVIFANSNGVTFGLTTGSQITASVAAAGATGSIYATGNTTQNSSSTQDYSSVLLGARGALSAGFSNGTIQLSAPDTSSLVGSLGISLSTNGSTITVSNVQIPHFEPYPLFNALSTTWAPTSSSWYFMPFELAQPMSGGRLNIMVAHGSTLSILRASTVSFQTGSTGTGSTDFTYARKAALYSVGAGTNSTRLESFWSNQWSLSIKHSVKVASAAGPNLTVSVGATLSYLASINSLGSTTTTTVGHSSTVASAASTINTTQLTSVLTSERNMLSSQLVLPIPFDTTIPPGLYYLALMWITGSTTAGTGNLTSTADQLSIVNQYAMLGNTNTAARLWGQTAATSGSAPFPGVGVYSAGSSAPPSTVAFSDLRTYASMQLNYFNLVNSTI